MRYRAHNAYLYIHDKYIASIIHQQYGLIGSLRPNKTVTLMYSFLITLATIFAIFIYDWQLVEPDVEIGLFLFVNVMNLWNNFLISVFVNVNLWSLRFCCLHNVSELVVKKSTLFDGSLTLITTPLIWFSNNHIFCLASS